MSGLGILASAFAGGAQAINQQATGDIDKQNRLDIAAQMSKIQEEANMRLAENQARLNRQSNKDALTDKRDFDSSDETIAARGKVADADNATQRRGLLATATDEPLNTALREKQSADAAAAAKVQRDATKEAGNDPTYLKALRGITTAQHFFGPADALAAEQLKNLKAVADVRQKLANETDPDKREALRNKEMDLLGTGLGKKDMAVALAQTENAAAKARATLSDPMATEDAKSSAKDSLTALQWSADNLRKQMGFRADPGGGSAPYPDGTELKGKDGQIYVVKEGQPVPKGQGAAKPAVTSGSGLLGSAAPAAKDSSMTDDQRWVMNKLMSPADGPAKLLDISRNNGNPAFRQAARELYEAYKAKQDSVDTSAFSTGL